MANLMADAIVTFNLLTAFSTSGISSEYAKGANMADEPEDPDAAADRLEAALERIALLAAVPPVQSQPMVSESDLSVQEIAERLDSLIGRLRTALAKSE